MTKRTDTLYCTEGGSDKQYTLTLNETAGGYTVVCFNGRRGGSQARQEKTPQPVSLEVAEILYDRIFREKSAQGYKPGYPAAVMAEPAAAPVVTYRPMLLNEVSPAEAERYLRDPGWFMQQKADGVRCIVQVDTGARTVAASSRTDKPVALTVEITDALLAHFAGDNVVLDCEACGDVLVIFDILRWREVDMRTWRCENRVDALESLRSGAPSCLSFIQTARTEEEKRFALRILQEGGAEGVVFKSRTATYSAGRSDAALKWKFKASCSLRVIAVGTNGKASIDLALADGTRVATASTIGKKVPQVGDVVDVVYLYAYRGGCLVQAIYKAIRTDVEPDTAEELQYKGEERAAGA